MAAEQYLNNDKKTLSQRDEKRPEKSDLPDPEADKSEKTRKDVRRRAGVHSARDGKNKDNDAGGVILGGGYPDEKQREPGRLSGPEERRPGFRCFSGCSRRYGGSSRVSERSIWNQTFLHFIWFCYMMEHRKFSTSRRYSMRHIMSPLDFSVEELDRMMDLAGDIEKHPDKYAHACDGKKIATLFYEPSTRTRLSFETAMLNLGGSVIGFASADSSSAAKGESVSDTIRVISCFADICAIETSQRGRASRSFFCFFYSSDQCRRRRPPASHPDISPIC